MVRMDLRERGGRSVSPENVVAEVLRPKENWVTISSTIVKMQSELVNEIRRRIAQRTRSKSV